MRSLSTVGLGAAVLFAAGVWSAGALAQGAPPRFEVTAPSGALTFVMYGDTRFTERSGVVNATARRALVDQIAAEKAAAVFIGGDLIYQGSDPSDYAVYKRETAAWSDAKTAVFPALGNHEFKGCAEDAGPCLENWWKALSPWEVRPWRWYSVALGPKVLVLLLDSDSDLKPATEQRSWLERQVSGADSQVQFILIVLHYPPVRDPLYPRARDEKEVATYLSHHAAALHAQVIVVGSHVHNYERFRRDGVNYLVSGGGGANPVPAPRLFGELSKLTTAVNYHYIRFVLQDGHLSATMVRFDAGEHAGSPWTEPDRFEVDAKP